MHLKITLCIWLLNWFIPDIQFLMCVSYICLNISNTWLNIETILGHLKASITMSSFDWFHLHFRTSACRSGDFFYMSNKSENCRDFYFLRIVFTLNLLSFIIYKSVWYVISKTFKYNKHCWSSYMFGTVSDCLYISLIITQLPNKSYFTKKERAKWCERYENRSNVK